MIGNLKIGANKGRYTPYYRPDIVGYLNYSVKTCRDHTDTSN